MLTTRMDLPLLWHITLEISTETPKDLFMHSAMLIS